MEISKRIQILIKRSKLSNTAFADSIGVQPSSISHILSGRNKPSVDFIQKLLSAYPDISAEWLLLGKEEEIQRKTPVVKETPEQAISPQKKERRIIQVMVLYDDNSYEMTYPTEG